MSDLTWNMVGAGENDASFQAGSLYDFLLSLLYKIIKKEINLIDYEVRFRETDFPRWLSHFLYYL